MENSEQKSSWKKDQLSQVIFWRNSEDWDEKF